MKFLKLKIIITHTHTPNARWCHLKAPMGDNRFELYCNLRNIILTSSLHLSVQQRNTIAGIPTANILNFKTQKRHSSRCWVHVYECTVGFTTTFVCFL